MIKDGRFYIIANMDMDSYYVDKYEYDRNYNRSIVPGDFSKGTFTRWNISDVSSFYTPEASLGHEILSHGYNRFIGLFRDKLVENDLGIKFREDEWDAVNFSNQILYNQTVKFKKNLKLRFNYGGVPIPESEYKTPKDNDIPNR